MRKIRILTMAMIVLFAAFSAISFAQTTEDVKKFRLGAEAGYHLYMDSEVSDYYNNNILFGANIGYMVMDQLELSASFDLLTTANKDYDFIDFNSNILMIGAYYHMGNPSDPICFKIGAGAALLFWNIEGTLTGVTVSSDNETDFGFWGAAGVEFPISSMFLMGPEIRFSYIDGGTDGAVNIGGLSFLFQIKVAL